MPYKVACCCEVDHHQSFDSFLNASYVAEYTIHGQSRRESTDISNPVSCAIRRAQSDRLRQHRASDGPGMVKYSPTTYTCESRPETHAESRWRIYPEKLSTTDQ